MIEAKPRLFSPAMTVTIFTVAGQTVVFLMQIVVASFFGAGAAMDAYLAASALPQYVVAVLLGSLGFVFLPTFIDRVTGESREDAWRMASSVINLSLAVLLALTAIGLIFSDDILRLTAPGLTSESLHLSNVLALIIWPTVLGQGLIALLTGIFHAESRFGWAAAVPLVGSAANLALLLLFARWWGIIGLAVATTAGLILQVLLLLPIALKRGRYRFVFDWKHPGVIRVFLLVAPLAIASIVGKSTTVVERFFASSMNEGSISHLGYAFRLLSVATLVISTGISTVAFPKMAASISEDNLPELRKTMSDGLRYMWLFAAPVTALGIALAYPLVATLFERGQFTDRDSLAVAHLLQIYLLSCPSGCLASITARGFYVLKDTRTVALMMSIESLIYIGYTGVLARNFGATGIAIGYVLLFSGSLLWQIAIIRRKLESPRRGRLLISFFRTTAAAIAAGSSAVLVSLFVNTVALALIVGSGVGIIVYGLCLVLLKSEEFSSLMAMFYSRLTRTRSSETY